jgi:hypothetical protein
VCTKQRIYTHAALNVTASLSVKLEGPPLIELKRGMNERKREREREREGS